MSSNCENCSHLIYDEVTDSYFCDVDLDEDEYERCLNRHYRECPYFDDSDEYKVVRHQI